MLSLPRSRAYIYLSIYLYTYISLYLHIYKYILCVVLSTSSLASHARTPRLVSILGVWDADALAAAAARVDALFVCCYEYILASCTHTNRPFPFYFRRLGCGCSRCRGRARIRPRQRHRRNSQDPHKGAVPHRRALHAA